MFGGLCRSFVRLVTIASLLATSAQLRVTNSVLTSRFSLFSTAVRASGLFCRLSCRTQPSSCTISGAYGGSEVGAMVGGMVGPPVIGNIVGGLVGEVVGADAVSKCGLDDKAKKVGQTALSA